MACGPERTAPTAPAGQAVWGLGLGAGPGRGGWGRCPRAPSAGPGLAAAPGGRGEGRSGLGVLPSSRSPGGALGLFSSYGGHSSLGVGERGGGEAADLPAPPRAPSLASAAVLSSYMDGHGTMGGTRHRTQDRRSPCRREPHGTEGAGDAPGGHASRGGPADPGRQAHGPDEAQGQKQPPSRGAQPGHGSARERGIVGRQRAPCRRPRGHAHRHQHGHTGALGSNTGQACLRGTGTPGGWDGGPLPPGREVCGCRGAGQGAGGPERHAGHLPF